MKKTLYVSDLDGTLLDRNSQLSDNCVMLLNKLITEYDVDFTIATARTPATVVNIMKRVKTKLPFVVMNGAATWDNLHKRFTSTSSLSQSEIEAVCNIFETHGIQPMIYRRCDESIEVRHCGELSSHECAFVKERQGLALKKFFFDDMNYRIAQGEALLIFSMTDYDKLKAIHKEVASKTNCSSVCYHDIFDSSAGLMETYAPDVSKAKTVRRLVEEIGAERLVVFGDNRNDIPMMEIADIAVAPKNATDEVKAIADIVIEPNHTDSVARFILNENK